MRVIDPTCSIGRQAKDPEVSQAKQDKSFKRAQEKVTDTKWYRLYHGDMPAGMLIICNPVEVISWNANARAYFAHQATLGRTNLPLLQYKEVENESYGVIWTVKYSENGKIKEKSVWGMSKADAKKEFNSVSSTCCVIKSIDPAPDQVIAAEDMRIQAGERPEDSDDLPQTGGEAGT